MRLLIAENRDIYFPIWCEAFRGIQSVSVLNKRIASARKVGGIDAEIMGGVFAHERYGGTSKVGISQILSTKGEKDMPQLVVTTPPFAAHLETTIQPDGSKRFHVVRDEIHTAEDEVYIEFSTVFDVVTCFNLERNEERKINSLIFGTELLGIPRGNIDNEIAAIRKAYLKHFS